jgi:hypothetical protein
VLADATAARARALMAEPSVFRLDERTADLTPAGDRSCSLYKVLAAAAVLSRGKPSAANDHVAEAAGASPGNALVATTARTILSALGVLPTP